MATNTISVTITIPTRTSRNMASVMGVGFGLFMLPTSGLSGIYSGTIAGDMADRREFRQKCAQGSACSVYSPADRGGPPQRRSRLTKASRDQLAATLSI